MTREEADRNTFGKEKSDRIADWREFSNHMVLYIEKPKAKYETPNSFDLMPLTPISVCIWNVLKYSLRCYMGHGKEHDFEKMSHYAQMAWTKKKNGESNQVLTK